MCDCWPASDWNSAAACLKTLSLSLMYFLLFSCYPTKEYSKERTHLFNQIILSLHHNYNYTALQSLLSSLHVAAIFTAFTTVWEEPTKPAMPAIKPLVKTRLVGRACFEDVILLSWPGNGLSRVSATPVGLIWRQPFTYCGWAAPSVFTLSAAGLGEIAPQCRHNKTLCNPHMASDTLIVHNALLQLLHTGGGRSI